MKRSRIIIIVLMLLSFIAVGVSFAFLDEIVPIHFGPDGTPDVYGSKYFLLTSPLIGLLIGGVMVLLSYHKKLSENYKKYMLIVGVILEVVFLVCTLIIVIPSLGVVSDYEEIDVSKIMMPLMGGMFIFMGNIMPKIEKNRTLGLKTYWSMYNEVTWQKSHRFCGFISVIIGIIILIAGFIFNNIVNFIILMSLLFVDLIASIIASYIYYKEEKNKEA